jgi:hypothetical protein
MSFGYIYKIEFPNGKTYIGLTTSSVEKRQKEHKFCAKKGDTRCLYNALRKYDMIDTFELIQIDTADTIDELCEKEIKYIEQYNSYYIYGNGYNMTFGGEGTNGYVFTENDKQNLSKRMKKYFEENPEERERMREMRKKQMDNPEARKQLIESLNKHWKNEEARKRQSEITKTHHEEHPETRVRQQESRTKTYEENPEIREQHSKKMKKRYEEHPELAKEHSERMKQYFKNPEAREICSKSQKKRFENPEEREKNRKISKKRFENPEARQQMSEIKKKFYQDNPEAIEKNREAQKNRSPEWIKKRNDTQGKNKPFDVFIKENGKFVKTFTYPFEAKEYLQKEYNITSTINIGSVLSGKRGSSAGFIFKYKEN